MKWLLVVFLFVVLVAPFGSPAQSLDDQYLQIFNVIEEADTVVETAPSEALAKYLQAQTALQRLQKASPDWNSKIVSFRLIYVGNKIAALSAKTPLPSPPAPQPKTPNAPVPQSAHPAVPSDWEGQLNGLKEQVRQLQANRVLLEAKLKEALAMQPAESDPRELARSEERVRALQKENELLKASAETAKGKPSAVLDSNTLAQTRQELADQKQLNSTLALEKKALETRLNQLNNATAPPTVPPQAATDSRIKQLELERDALERKLQAANKEKEGSSRKAKAPPAQDQDLRDQLLLAQARLEVLQARAVPYSAEELALLKVPEPKLAPAPSEPSSRNRSVKEMPPGSAELVAEAKTCFAAKQYDKAEAAYLQVLKQDPQSVPALANLAAIEVEANHFDAAEKHVQQAIGLDREDPYSLYVLGLLRLRQTKYDAALDCFSRCAKLEPQNAEVQNYLGLTLSEKGMRAPAEAALRKAIQIQPGYAGAHYNLAIVYLNQQPPAVELARWHYQKAIAAGEARNPDLEKKLAPNQ